MLISKKEYDINNEAKRPVTVQLFLEKNSFIEVSLFSGEGDLVYNFSDYRGAGDFYHIIRPRSLGKGKYWLRLGVDGNTTLREVLI